MIEKKIIGNGTLITLNKENEIFNNGAVYIEDNLIKDYGDTEEIKGKYPDAKFIDAKQRVIMPGLICAHHHLYSTFACGLAFEPASNFVEILKNLWWKLDKALSLEDIYYSALIPLIKCIRSGTTTIIDHHASPSAIKGSLFKLAEATKKMGIRSVLCYEVTDRGGEKERDEGIQENVDFIEKYGNGEDEMLSALFGLHASLTLSEDTLKKCVEANEKLKAGFHIHVAEDKADVDDSLNKYGKRIVNRLYDAGILGNKTIAAHCIHINEEEMDILARTGTIAVNNPSSNMNNAVGCADILKMFEKNVLTGLGTDGMGSNMFEEVKVAYLIQRHVRKDPRVAFGEACNMLLKNNSIIASRYFKHKVGVIEENAYADVIVVDYYPITPLNKDNICGHLMFGIGTMPVDTVIVNGKVLMENKEIKVIDEIEIMKEAHKFSERVWERFKNL